MFPSQLICFMPGHLIYLWTVCSGSITGAKKRGHQGRQHEAVPSTSAQAGVGTTIRLSATVPDSFFYCLPMLTFQFLTFVIVV